MQYAIREYIEGGQSPFADWVDALDAVDAARVDRYIRRLEAGNFGNAKPIAEGMSELKIDYGPGYRVYYGLDGKTLIILLAGGTKRHQQRDIEAALFRWRKYKQSK